MRKIWRDRQYQHWVQGRLLASSPFVVYETTSQSTGKIGFFLPKYKAILQFDVGIKWHFSATDYLMYAKDEWTLNNVPDHVEVIVEQKTSHSGVAIHAGSEPEWLQPALTIIINDAMLRSDDADDRGISSQRDAERSDERSSSNT